MFQHSICLPPSNTVPVCRRILSDLRSISGHLSFFHTLTDQCGSGLTGVERPTRLQSIASTATFLSAAVRDAVGQRQRRFRGCPVDERRMWGWLRFDGVTARDQWTCRLFNGRRRGSRLSTAVTRHPPVHPPGF